MPKPRPMPALAALLALACAAPARAAIEDGAVPGDTPVTTTWFAALSPAAQRADRDYVAGMRPHHAGALSMSRDYLADPGRGSPLLQALARAIIANQAFEIRVLDTVARDLDRPPLRLPFGLALQPVATEGLGERERFFRAPIPSALGYAPGPVTEADVRFAKAMTIHHEAALEMARGYHADPAARNGFLGLLNVDIITDQSQEIALMRSVIASYPGDPAQVRVDPAMVHGMEGMRHGGHAAAAPAAPGGHGGAPADHAAPGDAHGGHAGHAAHGGDRPAAPAPARPRPAPAPQGQGGHAHPH